MSLGLDSLQSALAWLLSVHLLLSLSRCDASQLSLCKMSESAIDRLTHQEAIQLLRQIQDMQCPFSAFEDTPGHDQERYPTHGDAGIEEFASSVQGETRSAVSNPVRDALQNFFDQSGGVDWYEADGWTNPESTCYCDWFGVNCLACSIESCEKGLCQVQNITLSDNNLIGDLATLLEILKEIHPVALDLSYNRIEGTLPDFEMVQLEHLNMYVNELQGSIPNFTGLPIMKHLEIDYNDLEGYLPEFTEMPLLEVLWCSSPYLTGDIPEFKHTPHLKIVGLYMSDFSGTVPSFSSNPVLDYLYFPNNRLEGSFPMFESSMLISYIYASSNLFHGSFTPMQNHSLLETLRLYNNAFSGSFPLLPGTPALVELNLAGNKFQGRIPDLDLPKLEILSLSWNKFTSLPELTQLPLLMKLRLFSNNINGTLPMLNSSRVLTEISLHNNFFDGTIPEYPHPNMEYIDFSLNLLQGTLPNLRNLSKLNFLDFSYNQLNGTVPESYEHKSLLKQFHIRMNHIVGYLPVYFWNLPLLEIIDLGFNHFEGDIGFFISPDTGIYDYYYSILRLDGNNLTGVMDWFIFDYVSSVQEIILSNNQLTHLGNLTNVLQWRKIDISSNPIVGSIPQSYRYFVRLQTFMLQNTYMNHGTDTYIPDFFEPTTKFFIAKPTDQYVCPEIESKDKVIRTKVDMDGSYYDYHYCACLPNYYGSNNKCIECPRNCDCTDGVSIKNCFASPSLNDVKSLILCPVYSACTQTISKNRTQPNVVTLACSHGYHGRVCSKCQDGFGKFSKGCYECKTDEMTALSVLAPMFFIGFLIYLYYAPLRTSGKLKILFFHLQTLSVITTNTVSTEGISKFLEVFSSVGSLNLPSVSCVIGNVDAFPSFLFNMMSLPIYLIAGGCAIMTGNHKIQRKAIHITLIFIHTIYYRVTRDVFGALGCTLYDEGTETWYLNTSPWVECSPMSEDYKKMVTLATLSLLFVLGFPLFIWHTLNRVKENPRHPNLQLKYGFLYMSYSEDHLYWEVVLLVRKMAFSLIVSTVPYHMPSVLYLLLFILLQASVWIQNRYKPYASHRDNLLENLSLYVIYFSFFCCLLANLIEGQMWLMYLVVAVNTMIVVVFAIYIVFFPIMAYWRVAAPPLVVHSIPTFTNAIIGVSPSTSSSCTELAER